MASPAGSNDHFHGADDAESLEDFAAVVDSDDIADGDYEFTDIDCNDSDELCRHQQSYTILSEVDISERQENDITKISSLLSISSVEAGILLLHYKWSVSKVYDDWFVDEEEVRKAVGLFVGPVVDTSNAKELTCGICFDTFARDGVHSAACGHPFCGSCWAGYIKVAVNGRIGSLALRCPIPSCSAAVGRDMIDLLAYEDDRKKYGYYFLRSYIEDNTKTKWCPAPGCDYGVEFVAGSGSYDVTCRCSYGFCWNCTEEAHRPVDCKTVAKWMLKSSLEPANMNWSDPNATIRSFHVAQSRERYTLYYERWAANHASMQKAMTDLQQTQSVHLKKLSDAQREPESQLTFITKAWSQIAEGRRVLKWTYVYGYYMPEHEHAKRQFLEYLQGEAEASLERLHYYTQNLRVYSDVDRPSQGFSEFRTSLADLTSVTRIFFENLLGSLENDLFDVGSHGVYGRATSSNTTEVGGRGHGRGNRGRDVRGTLAPTYSYTPSWSCKNCTYVNVESASACQMCNTPR